MDSITVNIIEIARSIDSLPFHPVTEEDKTRWEDVLVELNYLLCILDE